jgi:hypothetical protein
MGQLAQIKNIKVGRRRKGSEYYILVGIKVVEVEVVEIITTTVHPFRSSKPYKKIMYKIKKVDSNRTLPRLRSHEQIYRLID